MSRRSLLLFLCFATVVVAQPPVCVEISPNPILVGVTSSITVTVTDSTGAGFESWGNCVARTIRVGAPGGAYAPIPLGLCGGWTPTAPNGTATKTFNFINSLGPGLYYVDVVTRPVGGGVSETTWAPFMVQNPGDPNLSQQTTLQVGMPWMTSVSAPNNAGQLYQVAASFGTDTGFTLPGGPFVSLDMDGLFNLTYPVASSVFTNFLGVTDGSGNATGITANVPNVPTLAFTPVTLQGGLIDGLGTITLTNPVGACIQP